MLASAKLNKGIDEVFLHIAREMANKKGPAASAGASSLTSGRTARSPRQPSLILTDEDEGQDNPKDSGCCG